jgi:PhnB protein
MPGKSQRSPSNKAKAPKKTAIKKIVSAHRPQAAKTSLAPMLSVRNGAEAVEFYKAAFGARELFKIADPGGAVVAQLAVGTSEFWLADESPEHLNFSPQTLGGATARMVIVADDPDAVFAQATAAGASVVWPVADQPYGWRVGRVVDPFGHHWEIGKPLPPGQ